jgi:hypothetical protein
MAEVVITPITATLNALKQVPGVGGADGAETVTSSDVASFAVPKDGKYLILIDCAAGGKIITIAGGTDALKYSQGALACGVTLINTNHGINAIVLESARFKFMSGTYIGTIRFTTDGTVTATVIALP